MILVGFIFLFVLGIAQATGMNSIPALVVAAAVAIAAGVYNERTS